MSEEQLKAFLEAVKADAGLQEKLKAAADADAVVAIAKAAGFVISVDDIMNFNSKVPLRELSEEDLEGMTGGALNIASIICYTVYTCGLCISADIRCGGTTVDFSNCCGNR